MSRNYWQNNYSSRRISDDYDGWLDVYGDILHPGDSVLDLGCGAGTGIPALLGMGIRVTAADFSRNAMETVRAHFGESLIGADCFDMQQGLPYRDGCFDAVVADLSLHYFSWRDTCRIISDIKRVLADGGRLVARVHSLANLDSIPETEIEPHYYMMYGCQRRYFSMEEIRDLFSDWHLCKLQEKEINRYNRIKHIFEFVAEKR